MNASRILGYSTKIKSALQIIVGGHVFAACLATYWGNEPWYRLVIMPSIRLCMDAETSHKLAIQAAKNGLLPRVKIRPYSNLETKIWDYQLPSPIGLAAGFDKDGAAINGLADLGFSFIEIGSVTPLSQEGNPKPRVFRLDKDLAVINRYGFNSIGHEAVHSNLESFKNSTRKNIVGVNLGKNKDSKDPIDDFIKGIKMFASKADYLVINLSSPNTPGLRNMQLKSELEKLLNKIEDFKKINSIKLPPLLLKVSPDLSTVEKKDISNLILNSKYQINGLVVSNTSISRPTSLISSNKNEEGGLSGLPIKDMATQSIEDFYLFTKGRIPIIGVGGIFAGADAYEKMRKGASLVQIYTSFTYQGPAIVAKIKKELHEILIKDGFNNISEVVGIDVKIN